MEIRHYKPCSHKTIKANFSVYIPSWSLTLHKFKLIDSNGGEFVAPPSEQYEKDGETKYAPYFFFDKEASARFYDKVLEEVKKIPEYQKSEVVDTSPAVEEFPF